MQSATNYDSPVDYLIDRLNDLNLLNDKDLSLLQSTIDVAKTLEQLKENKTRINGIMEFYNNLKLNNATT